MQPRDLTELGFDEREAEIYLSLLQSGESPVGLLVKSTGFHKEIVYQALQRLEKSGYVQSIEKRKIKHFIPEEPDKVVEKAEKKLALATSLLPEMKKIYQADPVLVRVYEGSEGYEEIQQDVQKSLKDNDEYQVIGAGDEWNDITKDFIKKYRRKSVRRGIHVKMITYPKEASGVYDAEPKEFAKIRVLPNNFIVPCSTKIYADKIIIQIFGYKPVAIMVQSEPVAKSYREYFWTLWRIAKDYSMC